jgi:hypothetical protein
VAQKKKVTNKSKDAKPAAKQKETPADKPKAVKKAAVKTEATEKKSPAKTKAVTKKKLTGTMENKEIPAEPNTNNELAASELKLTPLSDAQKLEVDTRTVTKDQLNEVISAKFIPMLSNVVKLQTKASPAAPSEIKVIDKSIIKNAAMPADSPSDIKEAVILTDGPMVVTDAPVNNPPKESGSSLFGIKFDFKKMESGPFDELSKIFREFEVEESAPVEHIPMVIVADFTLPYRCCDDYVCEDMCYTEKELSLLPIPPFAKDDFAVTRKNTPVDIYPDMNDSHLFKNFIVVKEIHNGQNYASTAGGKVESVQTGERPHFRYTPPQGQSGISDSFPYTLLNLKNHMFDTAIVWIEVAEAKPSFSVSTPVCHNAGPQPIAVVANGNNWADIDVTGNGVIKTGTTTPAWSFDPQAADVVIGTNTLMLTLNGQQVQTIDVVVTEILADFSDQGELTSIDPATGIGTIVIHDQSLNVQIYNWEWRLTPNSPPNTAVITPGADGSVVLPLPGVPHNADFLINVTLTAKSPQGCIDKKELVVGISAPKIKPLQSIGIVEKYSILIPDMIEVIDPALKRIVDPTNKTFPELLILIDQAGKQVSDPSGISVINNGGYDSAIEKLGLNIQKMLPANTPPTAIPENDPYRETVFTTAIVAYSLLALRNGDATTTIMASTLKIVVDTVMNLSAAGFFPDGLLLREFDNMANEVKSKTELNKAFVKIESEYGV